MKEYIKSIKSLQPSYFRVCISYNTVMNKKGLNLIVYNSVVIKLPLVDIIKDKF